MSRHLPPTAKTRKIPVTSTCEPHVDISQKSGHTRGAMAGHQRKFFKKFFGPREVLGMFDVFLCTRAWVTESLMLSERSSAVSKHLIKCQRLDYSSGPILNDIKYTIWEVPFLRRLKTNMRSMPLQTCCCGAWADQLFGSEDEAPVELSRNGDSILTPSYLVGGWPTPMVVNGG